MSANNIMEHLKIPNYYEKTEQQQTPTNGNIIVLTALEQ